jgi:glycosyltransferase involved in cell wall biosynthesis
MQSLGHDIRIIARIHDFQPRAEIEGVFQRDRLPLTLIPHAKSCWKLMLRNLPAILRNPALLDGAALEYLDSSYLATVKAEIERFKPDVLWMEYCGHWPLLTLLRSYGIPMILKSSNNEAQNCIDDHGGRLMARIKAMPKFAGERIIATKSNLVLAITPDEERWYRSQGAKNVLVLPLRGLSRCLEERVHSEKKPLDIVFLSSNYNMGHNRDAFLFLLRKILPEVRRALPGKIRFHLTGSKFRDEWKKELADDLIYEGFVEDLGGFLRTMDCALCPWITGQGMQQKVFEPLCRSLPLLTTKVGGYPFENGTEVLLCKTPEDYVQGLQRLLDPRERNKIASAAHAKAKTLFSEERMKDVMTQALAAVIHGNE